MGEGGGQGGGRRRPDRQGWGSGEQREGAVAGLNPGVSVCGGTVGDGTAKGQQEVI